MKAQTHLTLGVVTAAMAVSTVSAATNATGTQVTQVTQVTQIGSSLPLTLPSIQLQLMLAGLISVSVNL